MDDHSELDEYFSRLPAAPLAEADLAEARRLGIVVGGRLSKGLNVKLDRSAVVEGMACPGKGSRL